MVMVTLLIVTEQFGIKMWRDMALENGLVNKMPDAQAIGPEFRSSGPTYTPGMVTNICNSSVVAME